MLIGELRREIRVCCDPVNLQRFFEQDAVEHGGLHPSPMTAQGDRRLEVCTARVACTASRRRAPLSWRRPRLINELRPSIEKVLGAGETETVDSDAEQIQLSASDRMRATPHRANL